MDSKKSKAVALFKFGLISPVINDETTKQTEYFKELSQKEIVNEELGIKHKYGFSTFKDWLNRYRNAGFDALAPNARSDKGFSKKIDQALHDKIVCAIKDYPYLSCAGIFRLLLKEGHLIKNQISEVTLRNYIYTHNLRNIKDLEIISRRSFESPAVNLLWISDFMHCYPIVDSTDHNKKKKTYLCAIIDDHSRLIVGSSFFFHENVVSLSTVFKSAILQYGISKKFYCDNGAAFSTHYLQEACARLGVALLHSKPYDSPSRGKIERFFRTVREMFLPLINFSSLKTLCDLNQKFKNWLEDYHTKIHSGINDTPKDKYLKSLTNINLKRLTEIELDKAFYQSFVRLVKNDSTVSIDGTYYEVPPEFIGSKSEFRCPLDKQKELYLYVNGKSICQVKPVNKLQNFEKPYSAIRFHKEENND